MRKLVWLSAALLLLARPGTAQSDLSPNTKASVPLVDDISCPDSSEIQACNSFAELTRANDASVVSLVTPAASASALSFVCFQDFRNAFFTVRYANFPSAPKQWLLAINQYEDGVSSSSGGLSVLAHHLVAHGEDEQTPPPVPIDFFDPKMSIYVSASELEVSTTFQNVSKGQTGIDLIVQLHTGRFKISGTYDDPAPATGKPRETGTIEDRTGRCVNLWSHVRSSAPGTSSESRSSGWTQDETLAWQTYQALGSDDQAYVRSACQSNPKGAALVPRLVDGGPPPNHAIDCASFLSATNKSQ